MSNQLEHLLKTINPDIDTQSVENMTDEDLDDMINSISEYLTTVEESTKLTLKELALKNGGILKGEKFDYILDEYDDLVPRVNVKYARPFPMMDFIIRDGIPYIVIDRDEVYDISHLIDYYNAQFNPYISSERIFEDDDD